ncbi:MAG: helix-turn-helix domain-containing protein, partial [Thermoplasmata archaeon]|nr:helix-turn-helix domain-containing protein [Thermoplasmata archaeon]
PEKQKLILITKKGKHSARTIYRAKILLMADKGKNDIEIGEALGITSRTSINIRKLYAEKNMERALCDAPRPGQPKTTTVKEEAEITAIACTDPEDGYGKWTIDLICKKANKKLKNRKKPIGRTTIHNILLKSDLKPWREKNVVYSENNKRIQRKNV